MRKLYGNVFMHSLRLVISHFDWSKITIILKKCFNRQIWQKFYFSWNVTWTGRLFLGPVMEAASSVFFSVSPWIWKFEFLFTGNNSRWWSAYKDTLPEKEGFCNFYILLRVFLLMVLFSKFSSSNSLVAMNLKMEHYNL